MPEFNAHNTLAEAGERHEQLSEGSKLVPVSAAVIAVFAALATLFSNHSSVSGLEKRTLAGIYQTRAADDYSYYESSRLKVEVNQTFLQSGLVTAPGSSKAMSGRIGKESAKAAGILKTAQKDEEQSNLYLDEAEKSMASYEKYEVATTLFEVSIVLVSVTALMRTRMLMWIAYAGSAVGLVFFFLGWTV
jgi:hypothetical protein